MQQDFQLLRSCGPYSVLETTHLDPHRVNVDLLVQIVEKSDSLDNHGVDLVGGELELVAGERVRETEFHGREITRVDVAEEGRELLTDTSVKVLGRRVGNDRDSLELLLNGTS